MNVIKNVLMGLGIAWMAVALVPSALAAPGKAVTEVAIAPEAKGQMKDIEGLLNQLFLDMDPGDTLIVSNAFDQRRIATLTLSDKLEQQAASVKMKLMLKLYPQELSRIASFLKSLPQQPPDATANLPRYLHSLEHRRAEFPGKNMRLIYFGSPVVREPEFVSMVNRYPSDSHLVQPDNLYSTVGRGELLKGVDVHLIHSTSFGEFSAVDRDLHQQKLRRFYALMIQRMGGSLKSFTGAPDHLAKLKTAQYPTIAYNDIDSSDGKLRIYELKPPTVLKEESAIQTNLWQQASIGKSPPPGISSGPIDIGITWNRPNVDIDLYVQAEGEPELSYKQTLSTKGKHIKDITSQSETAKGFETVTYASPVAVGRLKVFVNHYAGNTAGQPTEVEVRVRFAGHIYSKKLQLSPGSGTHGGGDRNTSGAWARIDVPEILGSLRPTKS